MVIRHNARSAQKGFRSAADLLRQLVEEHIKSCAICAQLFNPPTETPPV